MKHLDDREGHARRNALGQETRWVYNALNVVVKRIDAASGVLKREVDACGNLVRATNPLGEVTRFQHGARGNLLSVEDPKGRTLTVGYTAGGELAEVSDWEGHVTRYDYDDRGQLVKTINPSEQRLRSRGIWWGCRSYRAGPSPMEEGSAKNPKCG